MALIKLRRKFTLSFKLKVLNSLKKNNNDITKTAKEYGIQKACIYAWRDKEIQLGDSPGRLLYSFFFGLDFFSKK
jgi:transposase-like protein